METVTPRDVDVRELPTEEEVEKQANSKTGIMSYFRIASCEWRLWTCLTFVFGTCVFVYSVSRTLKDAFVISKQLPVSISFLKLWVILPLSVFVTGLIQRLLSTHSVSKIFNAFLIAFGIIYFLQGLFFLPFAQSIQPGPYWSRDMFADEKMKGKNMNVLFPIILILNEWTSSFVYVTAEIYGSVLVQYIFLAFVNEVLTSKQNTRFIPPFYIISNILLMGSGLTNIGFGMWAEQDHVEFRKKEFVTFGFFVVGGILTFAAYFMKKYVENTLLNEQLFIRTESIKKKGRKQSASFLESLKLMIQSKFLIAIVLNSLFYYIAINLVELSWKNSIRVAAEVHNKDKDIFTRIVGAAEQLVVGFTVVIVLLSPLSNFIQTHGWLSIAIVPPIIVLVSSMLVFGAAFYNYPKVGGKSNLFFNDFLKDWKPNLLLECYGGLVAVAALRVAKYAFFDISKEAISMQIDVAYRAKFKAIYDGLCGKLGKSMGSLYGVILSFFGLNDARGTAPITLILCVLFSLIWIRAVIYLNKKYKQAKQTSSVIDIDLFSGKSDFE